MVQPHLLERAQTGDPVAIEALLNLALEARGVMARTYLRDNCLYVCLVADQQLNRPPLIQCIRRGFATLGVQSIRSVKLVALQRGKALPTWTEEIALDAQSKPRVNNGSSFGAATSIASGRSSVQWLAPWQPLRQFAQTFFKQAGRIMPRSRSTMGRSGFPGGFHSHALTTSSLLILTAFLLGGIAAVVVNSQALHSDSAENSPSAEPSDLAGSQMAIQTDNSFDGAQQQQAAKDYLAKMIQAQRSFYQQQKRLATSLEELERSANLISRSAAYTYQLALQQETAAQLTATPKVEGLKSYRAIMALSADAEGQTPLLLGICESNSAAPIPPAEPQVVDGQVQCGVDATRLP